MAKTSRTQYENKAPRFDVLDDWLKWQEKLHFTSIELGLDRCKAVAKRMGLLKPEHTVISIAGTNGKGSSATMLKSIFQAAGYKTGCYMSPHLIRYNERIRLNGMEVDSDLICESFARIDAARKNISLTYFEFGTLAALDIFSKSDIDIAILEVGLGGRLDAVNVMDADVALVSSIALDHQFWLGKDRESIAREKAGIFRSQKPAICSDPNPPHTLIDYADDIEAKLFRLGQDFSINIGANTWHWQCGDVEFKDLPRPVELSDFQIQNASGVLKVLHCLAETHPVTEAHIQQGLTNFQLQGRFQTLSEHPKVIVDVAHNQQAARVLAENLASMPIEGKTHFVIGMLNDKDHKAVFKEFTPHADSITILDLESARATDNHVLYDDLMELGYDGDVQCEEDFSRVIMRLLSQCTNDDRIMITGSFLTVGSALSYFQNKAQTPAVTPNPVIPS